MVYGWSPKKVQSESSDSYVAISLEVKIKGLSKLPSLDKVAEKVLEVNGDESKLTISEGLVYDAMKELDELKKVNETVSVINAELADQYMQTAIESLNVQKRGLMKDKAKQIFSLVASRKWFKEFKSFDENKLTLNLGGRAVDVTFDYKEVQVDI